MGDMGDYWREARDHDRKKVNNWYGKNVKFITDYAESNDLDCDSLEGSQIRIDDTLDVWPQRLKWHNLLTNEYGQCRNQEELKRLFDKVFA